MSDMDQDRIAELCSAIGGILEDSSADILAAAYLEKDELLTSLARLDEKIDFIRGHIDEIRRVMPNS
jgi:hypothetical protein